MSQAWKANDSYYAHWMAPELCHATGQPCTKEHRTCRVDRLYDNGDVRTVACCKLYRYPVTRTDPKHE